LYLSEISHFATINKFYQDVFGTLLPPSRSCVAVGKHVLPGGRRVLLDCIVQCGSGEYMRSASSCSDNPYTNAARATNTSKLRDVLHVQSISHWAPVCVGPYSQVNTLRSALHFLAGQIGLIPSTMQLHTGWAQQLEQCWKNVASVLDALNGGSLEQMISGLVFASDEVYRQDNAIEMIESISLRQIKENGGIVPGTIDCLSGTQSQLLYGGYEDEGTWLEMKKEQEEKVAVCPLLLLSIPEMPLGAQVEVEIIAATAGASSCLAMNDSAYCLKACTNQGVSTASLGWDTGHDFSPMKKTSNENLELNATVRVIGNGCAAAAIVTAGASTAADLVDLHIESLLSDMLTSLDKVLSEARSGLHPSNAMHVRLYYVATKQYSDDEIAVKDDGVLLRSSLQSAISSWRKGDALLPASTVVPVQAMKLIASNSKTESLTTFLAMQILVLDLVHMETEIWIQKDRS
jgi:enamine deaminase RidA (YjgF/YER057c/UK114 family)